MRFAGLIGVLTLIALPGFGQGTKDLFTSTRDPDALREARAMDPKAAYVAANVTETLYHEMGHALIDALSIPIYGPEEYAADTFAVVLLNRLHSEAEVMAMLPHITANYLWFAAAVGNHVDGLDLWDVHGPDLQRSYNIACLAYGANPKGRRALLELVDLPDHRAETCKEEFDQAQAAWGAVLNRVATDRPGGSIVMDWVVGDDPELTALVTDLVARMNADMALPARINISVIPCGNANAYFDPDYSEIQICTELAAELAARAP